VWMWGVGACAARPLNPLLVAIYRGECGVDVGKGRLRRPCLSPGWEPLQSPYLPLLVLIVGPAPVCRLIHTQDFLQRYSSLLTNTLVLTNITKGFYTVYHAVLLNANDFLRLCWLYSGWALTTVSLNDRMACSSDKPHQNRI
jgi:hypothetical protein